MRMPRVIVSGLSGGTGKTMVSLGLTRAFTRAGLAVHPFKKGPDYIDTAWLALAARGRAGNLDPFFMDPDALLRHFLVRSRGADLAVIEGNRGFFDGRDVRGRECTAELAATLAAPVLLVVDITKMTRTAAALVAGCRAFPGGERIAGVLLNRAGGERHASVARRSVEELTGVPVLGVLPRKAEGFIVERRSGLVTANEHDAADAVLERMADFLHEHADLDTVLRMARAANDFPDAAGLVAAPAAHPAAPSADASRAPSFPAFPASSASPAPRPRIGVVRDGALWAYYEENLDALRDAGADLVCVSLLDGADWPDLDGLYLGGGDLGPHAAALAADRARKADIRARIEAGMAVYAEHAGFFYLCQTYTMVDGQQYAMTGIFSASFRATEKPARLGYAEAVVDGVTLFFPRGLAIKGHDFRYAALDPEPGSEPGPEPVSEPGPTPVSEPVSEPGASPRIPRAAPAPSVLAKKGPGAVAERDGLVYKSVFGSCMQVFAPAVPEWAAHFVRAAAARKRSGSA